ncbi:MAG: hypothetical protein JOZ84_05030, partial [Methylobacteriaceae bacterium]|nr:hypothetical protein [Methylobacteriaceae bacterium]
MVEILALLLLATVPHVALPASPAVSAACAFLPVERAVGNWRAQAALDLDLDAET